MPHTLSKSEFKLAYGCLTRLKYKKRGYPKASDTDEFMELLAEGGHLGLRRIEVYSGPIGDKNININH